MNTTFPPSFGEDSLAYGGALFCLTAMCAASLSIVLKSLQEGIVFERNWREPISVLRLILFCLYATTFAATLGDVIFLYSWGEVDVAALGYIMRADRIMDVMAFVPFTVAGYFLVRGEPVVLFQLTRRPIPVDLTPTLAMVKRQLIVVGLVVLLSLGVTIGK